MASSLAILIWHDNASSEPPPNAYPFTAAITGLFEFSIKLVIKCPFFANFNASFLPIPCISLISAPAIKALSPAPDTIITLTSESDISSLIFDINSSKT